MDNFSHIVFDHGRMDVKQGVQAGSGDMEIQNRLLLHQEKFTVLHSFIAENTAHRFLSPPMG